MHRVGLFEIVNPEAVVAESLFAKFLSECGSRTRRMGSRTLRGSDGFPDIVVYDVECCATSLCCRFPIDGDCRRMAGPPDP